jgi:hypothetical protein
VQALADKYHEQGLAVVAVQMTPEQDELVPEWRARGKYSLPIVLVPTAAGGHEGFTSTRFGVIGAPANLLLDANRRVVFRHLGSSLGVLENEIRFLLGLSPAAADRAPSGAGPYR